MTLTNMGTINYAADNKSLIMIIGPIHTCYPGQQQLRGTKGASVSCGPAAPCSQPEVHARTVFIRRTQAEITSA